MSVASLVLGIIAVALSWHPCMGLWTWLLYIPGLVLGIIGCVKDAKAGRGKGKAITGIVLNAIAPFEFWIICVLLVAGAGAAAA
ncbi:MAG: hypothetical protein IIZ06_07675 [Kiritimatiellae bacterium]|nr:hypothetical protein [Kiritimatiellia bacterium]